MRTITWIDPVHPDAGGGYNWTVANPDDLTQASITGWERTAERALTVAQAAAAAWEGSVDERHATHLATHASRGDLLDQHDALEAMLVRDPLREGFRRQLATVERALRLQNLWSRSNDTRPY